MTKDHGQLFDSQAKEKGYASGLVAGQRGDKRPHWVDRPRSDYERGFADGYSRGIVGQVPRTCPTTISGTLTRKQSYVIGYLDGKAKVDRHMWFDAPTTINQQMYVDGYKDGRGHRTRRYKR